MKNAQSGAINSSLFEDSREGGRLLVTSEDDGLIASFWRREVKLVAIHSHSIPTKKMSEIHIYFLVPNLIYRGKDLFCSRRSEIATNKISPPADIAMYTIRYARRVRHRPTLSLPFFSRLRKSNTRQKNPSFYISCCTFMCLFRFAMSRPDIFAGVSIVARDPRSSSFFFRETICKYSRRGGITTGGKESVSSSLACG